MNFNQFLLQLPKLTPVTLDDSFRQIGITKNRSPFRPENRDLFFLMNNSNYEKLYTNPHRQKQEKYKERNQSQRMKSYVFEKIPPMNLNHSAMDSSYHKDQKLQIQKNSVILNKIQKAEFRNKSETLCIEPKLIPEYKKNHHIKLVRNPKIMLKELWDENYNNEKKSFSQYD